MRESGSFWRSCLLSVISGWVVRHWFATLPLSKLNSYDAPCRKIYQFWMIRKQFYNGCLWEKNFSHPLETKFWVKKKQFSQRTILKNYLRTNRNLQGFRQGVMAAEIFLSQNSRNPRKVTLGKLKFLWNFHKFYPIFKSTADYVNKALLALTNSMTGYRSAPRECFRSRSWRVAPPICHPLHYYCLLLDTLWCWHL